MSRRRPQAGAFREENVKISPVPLQICQFVGFLTHFRSFSVELCTVSAVLYAFSAPFYAFSTHFCSVSQCRFAPFPPLFHSIFYTVFSASLRAVLRLFCTIFAASSSRFHFFPVPLSPPPLRSSSKWGFTPSFSNDFWRHQVATPTFHWTQTIKNPPICQKPQLLTCKRSRIREKKIY